MNALAQRCRLDQDRGPTLLPIVNSQIAKVNQEIIDLVGHMPKGEGDLDRIIGTMRE